MKYEDGELDELPLPGDYAVIFTDSFLLLQPYFLASFFISLRFRGELSY